MYDVVAMGELLVDFIQNGCSEKGNLYGRRKSRQKRRYGMGLGNVMS